MGTIAITDIAKNQLQELSELTHEAPEEALAHAIEERLKVQRWQVHQVQEAVERADNGGKFINNDAMGAWVRSLGTDNELPSPKATLNRND